MHTLCFVILPDHDTHNYIRELELTLLEKFGISGAMRQSPHITIKYQFHTNDIHKFMDYLDKISSEIEPFDIELQGISGFEPTVMFMDVKENKRLMDLHLKILDDLKQFGVQPDKFDGANIKFHANFAVLDVTPNSFYEGLGMFKNANPHFKFKFDNLGILYYLGDERGWITLRKKRLKKA